MSRWSRVLDWPLRAKLAVLLVVASVLPLGVAAAIDIREARQRLVANTAALLAARGDELSSDLDAFHRRYQRSAAGFSRLPGVVEYCEAGRGDDASVQRATRVLLDVQPTRDAAIRGVAILDLSGTVRVATENRLVGLDLSYHSYVREALRDTPVISGIHLAESQVGDAPTIAYLAPVLGPEQALIGIVAVWVQAASFWDMAKVSNGLAGPGSFAVLFDELGVRIAHSYSQDVVFHPGGRLPGATVDALVAEHRFGTKTRELLEDVSAFPEQFDRARSASPDRAVFRDFAPVNGQWNYGIGRRLETAPWTVFYMIPESSLEPQIATLTRQKTVFAGAIILVALVAGTLCAVGILAPIGSLSKAADSIAGGDLAARVPAGHRDELGRLGARFNAMAERIEGQTTALQRSHDDLDLRVRERTAELDANELRLATVVSLCHRFTSQLDPLVMLQDVCAAARDVTLAQYAGLGITSDDQTKIAHYLTSGIESHAVSGMGPPPLEGPLLRPILRDREVVRRTNQGGRAERLGLPATDLPVHSVLGVPIASPTRVYGWIGLRTKLGADAFSLDDERIAVMIGTHAGIAYENSLLVADLRARQGLLEHHRKLALFQAEIGVTLASTTNIAKMLQQSAESMVRHLDAAFARFWLLNGKEQVLELMASAGLYTHVNGPHARIPVGELKIGLIAKERAPHITNTVVGDPRVSDQAWAVREGMVSFAGYPLIVGDDLVGVMAMFARKPLSEDTLRAMALVAPEIAIGVARKIAEGQLRSTLERTTFAMEAARMGVWELNLLTDRVTWSETLAPVFGLTPEQAPTTAESFFKLIHPDDRQPLADAVARTTRGGSEFAQEFRAIWPDGSTHWIASRARVSRHVTGTPLRIFGVGMDASDRKLLEAQLQQAQKLEAVGQLAGGVAHDFNNLLTAILGYSNFVLDTFQVNDQRRADLEEVIKAGERAVTLTRQLLAFSRKQVLQPKIVNINDLVTGMHKMLGRLIGEHIELVTVLASDLRTVRADPGQLEQVLMNLVVNARDAMPTGGRVALETANVELDATYLTQHAPMRPGAYVMLAVSDGGVGMSEETKRRLFEPFFTTKEPGKGTGLGLATVYGIVKQSGGFIWVYSEPRKGASFKIYLPIADQSLGDQALDAPETVVAAGTETVLVVEDEAAVRLLTRAILEKAGYRVFDAPNPVEAEALFEQNPKRFDLVVTDVIMPGSSGPKMFERLLSRRPDLKVIYVSGYTDDAIVQQGQLKPGVEFLQKPFTAAALNRKVREVLDR